MEATGAAAPHASGRPPVGAAHDGRPTPPSRVPRYDHGASKKVAVPPRPAPRRAEARFPRLSRAVGSCRILFSVAAITLVALSLVTVGWGVAKTAVLAHALVWEGAWRETAEIAKVLSILDIFLIATTIFVVAVGVWKLFVADLQLPAWLDFHELRSLKVVVADLLVLTVTVKLLGDFLVNGASVSFLREAAGVAIVNLTLLAFATIRSR